MSAALTVTSLTAVPVAVATVATIDTEEVQAGGWVLNWSDEFEGTSLNTNNWNYDIGGSDGGGWGNNELQYYTNRTDNVYVSDGTLKIVAKRESYGGCRFTSGRIKSNGKKSFKYGKMEARIKVNGGNQDGVWPAFWMMGDDGTSWPWCGELDIMEHANSRNYVEGTIHWNVGGYSAGFSHGMWGSYSTGEYYYYSDNTNNGINGWHNYGVIWDESKIQWYVDDNVYFTAYLTSDNAYAFQKAHYFLLNLALGSNATGYTGYIAPNDSFQSATMEVDYVRAYTWSDSGSSDTTTQSPSGMTTCVQDSWAGGTYWKYNLGSWAGATGYYSGGEAWDDFTLQLQSFTPANWGAMMKTTNFVVDKGAKYNYTVNFTSNQSGSMLVKEENGSGDEGTTISVANGSNSYTGSFTAASDQEAASILMDLRGMAAGAKIQITGFGISKVETATTTTTTSIPSGFTNATVNEWATVGNWGAYFGNWNGTAAGAYYTGSPFKMYVTSNDKADWLIQSRYEQAATAGHKYQVTAKITASKDARIGIKEDASNEADAPVYTDLSAGQQSTLTGTYEVASDVNVIKVMFEMGSVEAGTTVSFDSIEITDITLNPPSAPQGLVVATDNNARTLTIQFATVSNATSYNLYIDGVNKGTIANGGTYNMDTLTDGQTYTFAVTAVNSDGESEKSSTVEVTIPKKIVTYDAFSKIEAENFDSKSGMVIDSNSSVSNGANLGGVTNGSYAKFEKINFTEPAKAINLCYSSKSGDAQGNVEVYVDSLDNKVGTVEMENTGSDWSGYTTIQGVLDSEIASGTHAIYIKFVTTGSPLYVCNLDYFSFTKTSEYVEPIKITNDMEINGFQISTTAEGIRTVYSVASTVEGLSVSEVGLVYGINGASDDDLIVGSDNSYVASYKATSAGKLDSAITKSNSYAMTMQFKDDKTADNFSKEYRIRGYAKLSDGTYVYTSVQEYSIYTVAATLYNGKLMSTFRGHDYLYNTILKTVNSSYAEVDYNWSNILVKPGTN